jgi:hypothetical protein
MFPPSLYKSNAGTQFHVWGGSGAAVPGAKMQGATNGWQNNYFKRKFFILYVQQKKPNKIKFYKCDFFLVFC